MKHEISGPRRNNTLQSWQLAQLCVNLLISSTDLGKTSLGEHDGRRTIGVVGIDFGKIGREIGHLVD